MIIRILFMLMLLTGLTSCAVAPKSSLPPIEPAQTPLLSVPALKSWEIKGAIAIKTTKDSGSATIHWQQRGQQYHITLIGPIGSGSYELNGQPGKVELAASSGKRFYANTPEQLLLQQTGWALPISNLYFWVRGLPVPHIAAQKKFGDGHLLELRQQGWTIEYIRYMAVQGLTLPDKIFLTNSALNVKIVIQQWNF